MNKIIEVQDIVFHELTRLNNLTKSDLASKVGQNEMARSNYISNNAQTFIKAVSLNIKVNEMATRTHTNVNELRKELGVVQEEFGATNE